MKIDIYENKWTTSYLLEVQTGVEFDVVVAAPLLFLEPKVDDNFSLVAAFFFLLCVALFTASLYGKTISDGVTTTILVSVLQLAAFLSFFFGGPLHYTKVESKQVDKLINLNILMTTIKCTFQPPLQLYLLGFHSYMCTSDALIDGRWGTHVAFPFPSSCWLPQQLISSYFSSYLLLWTYVREGASRSHELLWATWSCQE
jgi:uncharacterized membrane protein YgdD (TMEM256/DUF423 family)